MLKQFRVAALVTALWPALASAQPSNQPSPECKPLTRDLAGPAATQSCVKIEAVLSERERRVDAREFPAPAAEAGQRETQRRVYYELVLPEAKKFEWSPAAKHPDTVLTLTATSSQDAFSMTVYESGHALIGTYSPRSEQQLLLTGNDLDSLAAVSLVIEVQFDGGRAGGFVLAWAPAPISEPDRDRLRNETPILQAYANRRVLTSSEYDQLIDFATCDTANTSPTNPCGHERQQPTHKLIDRLVPRDLVEDEEPVIAFVGIGGANRIVLINKRGEKDVIDGSGQETPTPVYTPRYRRTLPGARWFWALFVEDDQSPFETSIDVEFKPRATVSEVDEFDPSSLVSLGMKGAPTPRRTVRIGMRRIRVRHPPVAVEVAFTRQGAGYGLRQWRQVYRMRSWQRVSFGAGLFIPFITVRVENHLLHEPGLSNGEIPDFAVITPTWSRRQIFAMGEMFVPSWRNMADEAVGAERFWGTIAPHAVFGIGLPGEGGQAYYAGLGWNVKWEWLGITTGALIAQQSHLREGFRAGQRLTDKSTPVSEFADTAFVGTLLFGVTIDLLNLR